MENQLIKNANALSTLFKVLKSTETGKLLSGVRAIKKSKGTGAALAELAKHKSVLHNLDKVPEKFITVVQPQTGTAAGRFIRKELGNTASTLQYLTNGVAGSGKRAPLILAKNLLGTVGRNVRQSRYTTVSLSSVTGKNLKVRKGQAYYGKFFPKKIVGSTYGATPGKEQLILKKSPIGQAVGIATSAPAFGYYSYKASKEKNVPSRIGHGVGEAVAWSTVPTLAMASTFLPIKKKKLLESSE